jgi:hypothetical protein
MTTPGRKLLVLIAVTAFVFTVDMLVLRLHPPHPSPQSIAGHAASAPQTLPH